ncbi:hypothetical protein D3C75_1164040 [compost metagenome]
MLWKQLIETSFGRLIGLGAGLFFFLIYIFCGFWNMLFCALLLYIGYTVGKRKDLGEESLFSWRSLRNWLERRYRPFK